MHKPNTTSSASSIQNAHDDPIPPSTECVRPGDPTGGNVKSSSSLTRADLSLETRDADRTIVPTPPTVLIVDVCGLGVQKDRQEVFFIWLACFVCPMHLAGSPLCIVRPNRARHHMLQTLAKPEASCQEYMNGKLS
jgi:hypothetical protein